MSADTGKVLVTGADGFVGARLCAYVSGRGQRVRAMSRRAPDNSQSVNGPIERCYGMLADSASLAACCDGIHTVYHLAGIAHAGRKPDPRYQADIVAGTRNLLQAALAQKVERLVYFSSSLAARAEQSEQGSSSYAQAKLRAEEILLEAWHEGRIELVILRPVNVYGPGMQGNIATMMRLIRARRLPPLPRLRNLISLVGVDDLCQAAFLAATRPAAAGHTYLVTDGHSYAINEIETAIRVALGRKKPGWHTPRVLLYAAALGAEMLGGRIDRKTYYNLVSDNLFDSRELEQQLGFKPHQTFFDSLPAILAAL